MLTVVARLSMTALAFSQLCHAMPHAYNCKWRFAQKLTNVDLFEHDFGLIDCEVQVAFRVTRSGLGRGLQYML